MSGEVILLMAQVDDAPGELLGATTDLLVELGVKNIQLLPSLTKKGRPGYVLMIDTLAEDEMKVAGILAAELGVWGYRVLQSVHKHFDIRKYQSTLEINAFGTTKTFPLHVKRIFNEGNFVRVKAEHDDLNAICAVFRSENLTLPLATLKNRVETAVGNDEPGEIVKISI